MEGFATSSVATTTCSYFYEGSVMASSTCVSLTSEATTTPNVISTDPIANVVLAGMLMILSAMYVRRVFFS